MSLFEYKPNSNPDDLLFWLAIDISNTQKDLPWNEYDIDTHLKNLTLYLSKLKKEQLIIFEKTLQNIYPENNHIKDKIRQQLQYLRDLGLIEFKGKGLYKKLYK